MEAHARSSRWPMVVIVGALVVLVATASVFAAGVVARSSAELASRSSVIGASAAGAERVVFAAARPLDAGAPVDPARISDLETATADLGGLSEQFAALGASPALLNRLVSAADAVRVALVGGDLAAADGAFADSLLPAYEALNTELDRMQAETVQDIEGLTGRSRWAVQLTAWLVALIIPGAVMLGYRALTRRRMRLQEVAAAARLAAEREVTRAKDEFLANVSHELRTPLTAIFGFSSTLLEDGFDDPAGGIELLEIIHEQTAELQRLVEDILSTARSESGTLTFRADPVRVDQQVASVLAPYLRSGHRVDHDCAATPVLADPERLRQVVRNLVSNALRHGAEPVSVLGRVRHDRYMLAVRDHGPGVPAELEGRLFQRFLHRGSTPLLEGSVGLGLSVCAALMEGMGGDLAYSRSDDATLFVASIPLAPPPGGPVPEPVSASSGERA